MRGMDVSRLQNVVLNPYDYNHIFVFGNNDDGIAFLTKPDAVSDGCRALFGYGPRKLTPEEIVARRLRLKREREQKQRKAKKARMAAEVARAVAKKRNAWQPKPYGKWAREMAAAYRDKIKKEGETL